MSRYFSFYTSTKWLDAAWGENKKHAQSPILNVFHGSLRVIIMPVSGMAMRIRQRQCRSTFTTTQQDQCCIKISDQMRAFVHQALSIEEVKVDIDRHLKTISFTFELVQTMIKQTFEDLEESDETFMIEDGLGDVTFEIPTKDWIFLWSIMPKTNRTLITMDMNKKSMILKHQGSNWVAALFTKQKSPRQITFLCSNKDSMKTIMTTSHETTLQECSKLKFMISGLLQWVTYLKDGTEQIVYIAPQQM